MPEQATLQTDRLTLRPFTSADGPRTRELAGAREVAATTLRIPHPYPEGAAEEWIASHQGMFDRGEGVNFAITLRTTGELIGAIGLGISKDDRCAEIGYWVGVPYWSQGFVTEAARAVLEYGFTALDLTRIHAHHFAENPASGKVMQKLGMTFEGTLRQHIEKWGRRQDLPLYGILREEFEAQPGAAPARASTAPVPDFDQPVPCPIAVPTLETARLLLRALGADDAPALSRICDDPHFARAVSGVELPYTPEKALRFIEATAAAAREGRGAVFAIVLKETGEVIGNTGVWDLRRQHRRGSLGLLIAREQWGKRLAAEALRALIDYAFTGLHLNRLDAYCFAWNFRSLRLIERCGLKREGFRRQSDCVDGEYYDDALYGLLRCDYNPSSP
jgi:RimJ/RimL family protein N-acetyltransferase